MLELVVVEDKKYRYELFLFFYELFVNDEEILDMGWDEDDKNWEVVFVLFDRLCSYEEFFKLFELGL